MTDQEVIDDFITVRTADKMIRFYVTEISWPLVHKPMSEEVMVSEFATPMTGQQIEKEKIRISKLKKYFQRCQECDKLKPVGWMHDSKICQGCAQKKHGVVY